MASLLGSVFSDMADIPVDETLAVNAAASSSSAAQAYLSAAVASTTPEVRRLFMDFCTQSVMGNEAIMALIAERGWSNPYSTSEQQLQEAIQKAQPLVNNNQ